MINISLKKVAALMHVTAMEAQKACKSNHTTTGAATRTWDNLKFKLTYRENDVVLCLWKKYEPPTDYDVYIAKLNFFGSTPREIEVAKKGRFVWIKKEKEKL